jgi:hypothetical protein
MAQCLEYFTVGPYKNALASLMGCFGFHNLRHPYGLEDPEAIAIDTACNSSSSFWCSKVVS